MMQEETHIVGGEMALRGMRKLATGALRIVLAGLWFALVAQCALAVQTTLVADTVYLADGSVASGTVLIHWPAFTTAAGEAIPGGSTTVMVGADGRLRVALAPNAGATPAGAYYTVTMHLNGGAGSTNGNPVTTEYWVIPAGSITTTVAAIRSKVIPVTRAVPINAGLASTAGLVQRAGDTMQGPLTLSGDPAEKMEAATKQYVDGHAGSGVSLPTTSALIRGNGVGGGAVASRADVEATLGYVPLPASGTYDLNRDCGAAADFSGDAFTAHDNYLGVQACLNAHAGGTFVAGAGTYYFSHDLVRGAGQTISGKGHSYNSLPGYDPQQTGTTFFFAPGVAGVHLQGGGNLSDINIVSGDGAPRQATQDQANRLILPAGQYLSQWIEQTLTLSRSGGVVTASTLYGSWWQVNGVVAITGATPSSFNTPAIYIDSVTRGAVNSTVTWAQPGLPDETATVQAYILPATTGLKHGSGVIIEGPGEHVWNVTVANFSNNCFEVSPGPTGLFISDDTRFENSYTAGCAVNGISVPGGEDTSKGSYHHINNNFNMLYGANFASFLGDGVYDLQNSYNALSFSPPGGAAVAVKGCTILGNVETCNTSAAHGLAVGNGVLQAGMSVSALNTTRANTIECFVSAVPDATHFSCALPVTVANGSSTGGTVRLASGDEFLRGFAGDTGHYSVGRHGLAAHNLGLALYGEGGSGTHNADGCAMRMNASMLLIQPHFGDCISPSWMPSLIQSDGNYGLQLVGDQLSMSAGSYHFKPAGGNMAVADSASINGVSGDFHTKGQITTTTRIGVVSDNQYAFYIYNAAANHFNFCTSTLDYESIFNYPGASCTYHPGTPFQVYSTDSEADSTTATAGYDLKLNSGHIGLTPNLALVDHTAAGAAVSMFAIPGYSGYLFSDNSDFYFKAEPKADFASGDVNAGGTNVWFIDHNAGFAMKMIRPLIAGEDPVQPMEVATKQYVDGRSGGGAVAAVYAASVTPAAVAAGTCADQTVTVTGLVTADMLSQIAPPAALGNVSMSGYASAADTLMLHFCNGSVGSVTPPAGVYRFRATH